MLESGFSVYMIPYATSMADPFLDVQLLSQGTDLINDFSEVVGGYIADLKIGDDGRIFKKPIQGGDAYLDFSGAEVLQIY